MSNILKCQLFLILLFAVGLISLLMARPYSLLSPAPEPAVSNSFRLFSTNRRTSQPSARWNKRLTDFTSPNWSLAIFPKGASSFMQITMLRAIYEATNQTIDWTAVESKKAHIHLLRPLEILRDWPSSLFIPFFHLGGANFGLYNQTEALRGRVSLQLQSPYPAKIVSTFRDPREQAVSLHSWMAQSLPALRRKSHVGTNFWQLLVQYQVLGSALMNSVDQNHSELVVLNSHMLSTHCARLMQISFRTAEMHFITAQHTEPACQWALSRGSDFSKVKSAGATWHQHPLAWEMSCVVAHLIGPPFVDWVEWWAYPGSHSTQLCTLALATELFQNYTLWLQ